MYFKGGSQREILPPSGTERSGAEGSGDVNEGPPGGKRDSDAAGEGRKGGREKKKRYLSLKANMKP